ncbi:MAG: sugar kinase [Granulosicoccus sp.]
MKIACIGEAMVELSIAKHENQASIRFAGDTLNAAIYLKRSLSSYSTNQSSDDSLVAYMTVLGTDSFSDQIVNAIQSEDIDTQFIPRTAERVPGLYAINTDEQGERSFTYWRDQSAARLLFDESIGPVLNQLEQFDILYYSAITLAILPIDIKDQFLGFIESYRQIPGKQVAFDSNFRPQLWNSQEEAMHYTSLAWAQCDIALPSLDDEMALFGDKNEAAAIERLRNYGFKSGALKRGAMGPLDLAANAGQEIQFSQVNNVVDSTAAGDSFNGGYLASHISNQSSVQAMTAGHECASRVIQYQGAIVEKTLWENHDDS